MRIFIGHSPENEVAVEGMIERLRAAGHDVIIDQFDPNPGDDIYRRIRESIRDADAVVVLVSDRSFGLKRAGSGCSRDRPDLGRRHD